MITLEQAIEYYKRISDIQDIKETAFKQYSQLATWLDELRKYKENDFIELNSYTQDPFSSKTILVSIRKKEIVQFFGGYRGNGSGYNPCTRIVTNKNNYTYDAKESYDEIKEKLK